MVADTPVLKIPVDSKEWDAFCDKFMAYQKTLADQPDEWAKTNSQVKQVGRSFDHVQDAFDQMVKAATNPKFSDKSSGTFSRFEKSSKTTAGYWHTMSRDLEKSSKSFENFVRSGLKWDGLLRGAGMLGAGFGLAGAAVGAASKAADDLAGMNKTNRMFGLKPGQAGAFENSFGPAGGDAALIQKLARAKSDTSKWGALNAAGITTDEITSKDPEALAEELMQTAGQKFKSLGINGSNWANQTGVSDFMDPDQLRLAGSYDSNWYGQAHDRYQTELPKYAADQATLDEGTKAKQDFDKAWAELDLSFDKAAAKLMPDIAKFVDEAADWVSAFADSKDFSNDVDMFKGAVKDIADDADSLSKTLNKLFGLNDKTAPPGQNPFYNAPEGSFAANLVQGAKNVWGFVNGKPLNQWDAGPGPAIGMGSGGTGGGNDGSPYSKLMDAIEQNESSGINGQTNAKTGAAGLYGISVDNAKALGIDPMDPVESRKAAEKIYGSFYAQYHDFAKAAAAYDGDTHIDADQQKYGDWLKGAKPETINYLKKLEMQGQGLDLTADQQAYIDAHATVKANAVARAKGKGDQIDGFDVVPYIDGAEADKATVAAQMKQASRMDEFAQYFKEGGGSQFAGNQQQSNGNGGIPGQASPYLVQVQVTPAPGHNTAIIAGGLPQ